MEEKTDVPRQMCKHTDSFGHPADHDIRTCPECDMRSVDHGQTWISFEEYKKKYCREESQAPPADDLSRAANGLAEALRTLYYETVDYTRINNLGDPHHNASMRNARAALAAYEKAKNF